MEKCSKNPGKVGGWIVEESRTRNYYLIYISTVLWYMKTINIIARTSEQIPVRNMYCTIIRIHTVLKLERDEPMIISLHHQATTIDHSLIYLKE